MAFTPRTAEINVVIDILTATDDSGEPLYHDETTMGKAVVRAVAAELVKRELWIIVPAGSPIGHGPYWTRTEAENAWQRGIGESLGGVRAGLLRAFPWSPPNDANPASHVCVCGHDRDNHVTVRRRTLTSYRDCGRGRCDCPNYTERTTHA